MSDVSSTSSVNHMSGPKVAILTGGGDRPYALGLASALIAKSVCFDFIGSDDLRCAQIEADPRVRFLNLRGDQNPASPTRTKVARLFLYYCRLIAYAAVSRASIFHLLWNNKFEAFDRTLLLLYYKLLGKRLTFTAHNVNIRKRDGRDSWPNRFTLGIQYRLVDHIFVHTEQMKRELRVDFRVPESKISVIPFGINNTIPETQVTSEEARIGFGLAKTSKILLFFGNITAYKGLEYLVEAVAHLAKEGSDYKLIIAGRPKGTESYWEAIRRRISVPPLCASVIQRIEYVPDDETELYFKAADVLVLPYAYVFQSGVLSLGYNFGLPVIASDVGSLREDIIEGTTGYVFRPKDSRDLANTIERYFASDMYLKLPANRQTIRAYAQERYSWSKVGDITDEVYQRLTSHPKPLRCNEVPTGKANNRLVPTGSAIRKIP